ncbi:MAG: hypothetical protein EXS46_00160 [Candidatus Taylorbacteria bacterium]|nr:hypothetical protein [Candidatus Taylorbacteria bacterium]
MNKYTVIRSKNLKRAKKLPVASGDIHSISKACLIIEMLIPQISAWVERVAKGEIFWRFPVGNKLQSKLLKLQKKVSNPFVEAERMTAFVDCNFNGDGGVDGYFLKIDIFGPKSKVIVLIGISFTIHGDYLSYWDRENELRNVPA